MMTVFKLWLSRLGQPRPARASRGLEQVKPLTRVQRVAWVATAAALALGFSLLLRPLLLNGLETVNVRFLRNVQAKTLGQTLVQRARNRIVLVTFSDDTFDLSRDTPIPGPPLPREYHARVIRKLHRAGAKIIAFDVVFDASRPADKELAAAARDADDVLWACLFENDTASQRGDSAPQTASAGGQRRLLQPNAQLRAASPSIGHIHVPAEEADRVEAVKKDGQNLVPAFSLKAALLFQELDNQSLHRTPQGRWYAGAFQIPMQGGNSYDINYVGELGPGIEYSQDPEDGRPVFSAVPYQDVYELDLQNSPVYKDVFRDKIVVIGDTTTSSNDRLPTPLGMMWGMEIHAQAINSLLEGGFVRTVAPWVDLLALCAMSLLACVVASLRRLVLAAAAVTALLLGYYCFGAWLFVDRNWVLSTTMPMVGAGLASLIIMGERILLEEREKNRFQGLLRRYVSPQVADYVAANPDKCVLGGERVTATVLFSDIRGFTAMSEKLSPEEVVERLNEYLQAMTDTVFKHDGAVDKYVGDAIMALFGIPLPCGDHARRAVATAIDMQAALLNLQESWRAQGLPVIDIGVGINTGDMVVGNMGARERLDFTVIGDSVNLASRVESLNKEMKSRILVTATTYECVKDEVKARGPLTAKVKGKDEEAVVYEIYGWLDGAPPEGDCTQESESVHEQSTTVAK